MVQLVLKWTYQYISIVSEFFWRILIFGYLKICRPPPPPQFGSRFNERCAVRWIEWKNNIPIFAIFSLWDMVIFVLKTIIFWWIFTITRKIKIGKLFFHSFQHIAHLSWNWDQKWGGGGLVVVNWDKAHNFCIFSKHSFYAYQFIFFYNKFQKIPII